MTTFAPRCCSALAATLLALSARAADAEPLLTSRSTWRDAIVLEVIERYQLPYADAETAAVPIESSIFKDPNHQPEDPDVVVLEPMTVLGDSDLRRVQAALEETYGRPREKKRRWGTGTMFERDFGKVRVSVGSILFLPVVVGISW